MKPNATIEIMRLDLERLWPIFAHQAWENCDHRNKMLEPCSENKQCTMKELVSWFWLSNAKWN